LCTRGRQRGLDPRPAARLRRHRWRGARGCQATPLTQRRRVPSIPPVLPPKHIFGGFFVRAEWPPDSTPRPMACGTALRACRGCLAGATHLNESRPSRHLHESRSHLGTAFVPDGTFRRPKEGRSWPGGGPDNLALSHRDRGESPRTPPQGGIFTPPDPQKGLEW
jgi:hypothetical protein